MFYAPLIVVVLIDTDFNVYIPDAPFESFLVGVEKSVDSVAFNGSASVENLYGFSVAVTLDNHFGAEVVPLVGCYKDVAGLDFMTGGCYAVRIFAAAFRAGAIACHAHPYHLPLAILRSGLHAVILRLGAPGICCACEQTQYADNNQQGYQIRKYAVKAFCSSFFQLSTLLVMGSFGLADSLRAVSAQPPHP